MNIDPRPPSPMDTSGPTTFNINHSFPVELLTRIFVSACDSKDRRECATNFRISFVCSHWREIILSTAEVWTTVNTFYLHSSREAVETLLKRSRDLPIDISIMWQVSEDDMEIEDETPQNLFETKEATMWPILCALLPHCARWGSLVLSTSDAIGLWRILLMLTSMRVPQLAKLDVSVFGEDIALDEEPTADFTLAGRVFQHGAPSLRTLSLSGLHVGHCQPPSSGITSLSLRYDVLRGGSVFDFNTFKGHLYKFPALKNLRVHGTVAEFEILSITERVFLPKLKSLWIQSEIEDDDDRSILYAKCLSTPNLESLSLTDIPPVSLELVFDAFKERQPDAHPFPSLTRFHFRSRSLSETMMAAPLQFVMDSPKLTHLVTDLSLLVAIHAAMTQGQHSLPSLEILDFACDPTISHKAPCNNLQKILDWIQLRPPGNPLKELRVQERCLKGGDPEILARLRGYVPIGIFEDDFI